MSEPSDFISFADYLGLNDEAGQGMLDRSMSGADKLRSDALAASEANYGAAREAGEGKPGGAARFSKTANDARTGLASYSEFMQGMADPAARQALMEKTYGKGAVSWLDSALVGASGAGRLREGVRDAKNLGARMELRSIDADARRGRYESQGAAQTAENARGVAAKQAEADRREKAALYQKYWIERNTAPDSVRHSENWTQRDKEMYFNKVTRERGAQNKDGTVNADMDDAKWQSQRKRMYENRPKTFWGGEIDLGFGKGGQAPDYEDNWANYYAKNRTGSK